MYGLSNGENIFDLGWPLKVRFKYQSRCTVLLAKFSLVDFVFCQIWFERLIMFKQPSSAWNMNMSVNWYFLSDSVGNMTKESYIIWMDFMLCSMKLRQMQGDQKWPHRVRGFVVWFYTSFRRRSAAYFRWASDHAPILARNKAAMVTRKMKKKHNNLLSFCESIVGHTWKCHLYENPQYANSDIGFTIQRNCLDIRCIANNWFHNYLNNREQLGSVITMFCEAEAK